METLEFAKNIKATPEKVWSILFGEKTYEQWTSAFAENSTVETDWKKGSKAVFGDGTGNGMIARIKENIQNEYLSIEHLGEIKDGKENYDNDWAGTLENYTLEPTNDGTLLKIDIGVQHEWKDYFNQAWPKALDKVAELAEG
ncbi:SRPBCC domain-containing protein [Pedobacter aquatilis]|uniref:SRPBCC family protein n=1 Tax=Pedobacter aquatilis TaxID=351343 RepID=UPI0025B2F641|nr:SRPBCC domain-containing protein [Pedobacter aquatilis]MDN3586331.1 SRPBCC domain-containing protein [Pedobacter aquatilis]